MIEMSSTFYDNLYTMLIIIVLISFPSVFDRQPPASSSIARSLLSLELYSFTLRARLFSLTLRARLFSVRTAVEYRYAPSLRTCTSRPGTHRRCVRLRTIVEYMQLTTRYAPPLRIGRYPTISPSVMMSHKDFRLAYLDLTLVYSKGQG